MNTWAPIWSCIVDSSLWEEPGDVVKVFVTLMATKDSDHVSRLDAYRIAKKCNLDELEVLDILKLLASPDTRRKSPQEFEGRRIKAVEGGWLVLNGGKYRELVQKEMRRVNNLKSQQAFRDRQKALEGKFIGSPKTAEEKLADRQDGGDTSLPYCAGRAASPRLRVAPNDNHLELRGCVHMHQDRGLAPYPGSA